MSLRLEGVDGNAFLPDGGPRVDGGAADLANFGLLGSAPCFVAAMKQVRCFADTRAHVLVHGETGTGKELVARAIHYLGPRRYKPFVPVNCGALPDNLMENELFGHARGAFTDARESQPGVVGGADGGTLFLDEIECLSLKGQVALLRFLQDGVYRPLGARCEIQSDVRVIAASNRDFGEMVSDGSFRQDLLYRLAIMSLNLPPLRARSADIPVLVRHFIGRFAREYEKPAPQPDEASMIAAMDYPWPGNVRELENVVHRQFLLAERGVLKLELPATTCVAGDAAAAHDSVRGEAASLALMDMKAAKAKVIERFERDYLETLIAAAGGNVSAAARHAGKERRAFGKLLKKYAIDRARY